ncbi:LamG-like jellyroll fold domain-containing protein [Cohnella nanjingensis]|uniref:Beta-mannosidase n=1 Tax=Cohnella nanjingensis TaxID=1387779 RepID=A0A7X0RPX9_9BACL|nr:LamG-like jellyroll fold domain-containing protein [Cohnella nanjingensis]MBB6670114.1 hypothetical protein [Cohnella nanjingensis]
MNVITRKGLWRTLIVWLVGSLLFVSYPPQALYAEVILPAPLAAWSLDEGTGTTAADSAGGGYDGTLAGGAGWVTDAKFGHAADFATNGSKVDIPSNDIHFGNTFTLSFWVKTPQENRLRVLLARGLNGAVGHFDVTLFPDTGILYMSAPDLSGNTISGMKIDDGAWHHVAITLGDEKLTFYKDGERVTSNTVTGAIADTTSAMAIGALTEGAFSIGGSMADVQVFGEALSATQVMKLYDPTDSILGQWNLNEGTGTVAADSSYFGRDGTITGASWASDPTFGSVLDFSAAGSRVEIGSANIDPADVFSLSAWVKAPQNRSHNQVLLAKGDGSATGHFELALAQGTGDLYFEAPDLLGDTSSGVTIDDNAWHHLLVTYNGTAMKFYIDGIWVRTSPVTGSIASSTDTLAIGSVPGGDDSMGGLMAEVKIFSKAINKPSQATEHPLKNTLFDMEKEQFNPGPSPLDGAADSIVLQQGTAAHPQAKDAMSLNGPWKMIAEGDENERSDGNWTDMNQAYEITVPTPVTAALIGLNVLEDPFTIKDTPSVTYPAAEAHKDWYFLKTFDVPAGKTFSKLSFQGVAYKSKIWLNGQLLGTHAGMHDDFSFDVDGIVTEGTNTLVVKSDARKNEAECTGIPYVTECNDYLPPQGIWKGASLEESPAVDIHSPFIATRDFTSGKMGLAVDLSAHTSASGTLLITIAPSNFTGSSYYYEYPVSAFTGEKSLNLEFHIPNPRLWWPNGGGEQNLYKLGVSFAPASGKADYAESTFGIRTVELTPGPQGSNEDEYNFNYVVNGKPTFIKGADMGVEDALLRGDYGKLERMLTLGAKQGINYIRNMGGGVPGSDDFYALCDKLGIMVYQEWTPAWSATEVMPYSILEGQVRSNTLRLRNHPSLVAYGGGNELASSTGTNMTMMGKSAYELDGTRPFFKTSPWGGSEHFYDAILNEPPADIDVYLSKKARFLGEFGEPSSPNIESVKKFMPPSLPDPDSDLESAMEMIQAQKNVTGKEATMTAHALLFAEAGSTADDFLNYRNYARATQLAQATSLRHTIDLARSSYPESAGLSYYRLYDGEYPIIFWSTIDYYGVPKMSYYFVQDSYAPLHAVARLSSFDNYGTGLSAPIYLLDDNDATANSNWQVKVKAYDHNLDLVKGETYSGTGSAGRVSQAGTFQLSANQTESSPLLIVTEVVKDGQLADRTFYWLNFEQVQGAMFDLPKTTLSWQSGNGVITVTNTGNKPAVAVSFDVEDISDEFMADDDFFWLEPGESKTVPVNTTSIDSVSAWNADAAAGSGSGGNGGDGGGDGNGSTDGAGGGSTTPARNSSSISLPVTSDGVFLGSVTIDVNAKNGRCRKDEAEGFGVF